MHQVREAALLELLVIAQCRHRTLPLSHVGLDRRVHRHRYGPTAGVDQRLFRVDVSRTRCQPQSEPCGQCQHFGVIGIDELCAALACLAIGEVMAEHAPTNSIASLQHDDARAAGDQRFGAPQTGEPTTDDHNVELALTHLRTASVARR
jgi:hypothetical protein